MTQETVLFNDTFAGNIAYGSAGSRREAADRGGGTAALAHDFIVAMPKGIGR